MLTHQFRRVIPPQAHVKSVYSGRKVTPSLGGPRGQQPSCPGSHPQSVPHPPGARGRDGLAQESEMRNDQGARGTALPGSSGGNLFRVAGRPQTQGSRATPRVPSAGPGGRCVSFKIRPGRKGRRDPLTQGTGLQSRERACALSAPLPHALHSAPLCLTLCKCEVENPLVNTLSPSRRAGGPLSRLRLLGDALSETGLEDQTEKRRGRSSPRKFFHNKTGVSINNNRNMWREFHPLVFVGKLVLKRRHRFPHVRAELCPQITC